MAKNISIDTPEESRKKEFKHLLFRNALSYRAKDIINIMLDWKYSGKKLDKEAIKILMANTPLIARMSKKDKAFIELLMKQPEIIKGSRNEKLFAETILIGYSKANQQEAEKLLPIFSLDKVPDEIPDSIHDKGPAFDIPKRPKMQQTTERGGR